MRDTTRTARRHDGRHCRPEPQHGRHTFRSPDDACRLDRSSRARRCDPGRAFEDAVYRRRRACRPLHVRSRRPAPRLLEESHHRLKRSSCCCVSRTNRGLRARIDAMFRGDRINVSEQRSVLHVALRATAWTSRSSWTARRRARRSRGARSHDRVHRARPERRLDGAHRHAASGNVVNIGIGGSDLGPVMAYEALRHYSVRDLTFRFVSNIDGTDFAEAMHDLDPAETLFIVSSKTFTTLETMTNAHTARSWLLSALGGDATRGRQALRRGLDEREGSVGVRHRHRPTCSGSGTGSAAATRWTRRSASPRCSPSDPTDSARCSAGSTRWTSTSARRRSSAICRC